MKAAMIILFGAILVIACSNIGVADNLIVVESRDFSVGQEACSLGIWLSNDEPIVALVLMVEARALTGGAFYLAGNPLTRPTAQPGRRLDNSPLGSADPGGAWPAASPIRNRYPTPGGISCTGPTANTYQTPAAGVDAIPPDGFLYETHSRGDESAPFFDLIDLPAGTDYPTRDSASWVFVFNANNSIGCFEIDSCCVRPSGHTGFIDRNTQTIAPEFTKGIVCLESSSNQAPTISCPSSVTQPKDPGQGGAIANYTVTYFDEDLTLVPDCNPPSGSFFLIGSTIVTCIVTDTFGLADTCTFPITVVDADGNKVTIESSTFFIDQPACTVGVFFANVIPITGLVLPFDLRSISGGAFYLTPSGVSSFFSRRSGARLDLSPLGSADPGSDWPEALTTLNGYDNGGGTPCGTRTYQTPALLGGTSPDAVLYACVSQGDAGAGDEISLQAGSDPLVTSSSSWLFVFDANGNEGCFEIDTCCVRPSSHLAFLDINGASQPAGFTKGTICLEVNPNVNYPPIIDCPLYAWAAVDGSDTGAVVSFSVDVTDEDPTLEAVCTPPSGSFFPLGTSLVTCIVTDTGGLADTCSFDVVVHNADADEVVVESKTFGIGQMACTVGVFLENTMEVVAVVLPIEARSLTNGAFYLPGNPLTRPSQQPGMRLNKSPLGAADPGGKWPGASPINNRYPTPGGIPCTDTTTGTYQIPASLIDAISPDGWLSETHSVGDENLGQRITLLPGDDPRRTDSASWIFIFDMDTIEGCFEIDTCCVRPSGHLGWVDRTTNTIAPSFTAGAICLTSCVCECNGNPAVASSPDINVLDVVYATNVAFRNSPPVPDLNGLCPVNATDVDCDGESTVIDVVKIIDVAFRNGDPAVVFCSPCE